ncbi:MAG: acetyl-CoA C-acetyltransferase [Betaproteobacteria bacterium]|jgi:acetyl-CoA C-acetyltransferase
MQAQLAPVYLIDGARTPFLKARGGPGPFSASDLATQAGRALLLRQPFAPSDCDEVILGCAAPAPDEVNIGRVVALRMGCGHAVPGWTVMRNCASGLQAIDSAMSQIRLGRSHLVLAGGVDALSRTPLLYSDAMVRWFSEMATKKTVPAKLQHFLRLKPSQLLSPVIALLRGLTDPVVGLSMGQTAENLAHRFGINRAEMDAFSVRSHQRAQAGLQSQAFKEIVPILDDKGKIYAVDDGVREDSSLEGLAKLRPVFDKPYGNITAGNSSQVTDGAAWCLLASEQAVQRYGLKPMARLLDLQWAGLDPAEMGLGPVHAALPLMHRHGLQHRDIDLWEINEAFAAQVMACIRAMADTEYCRTALPQLEGMAAGMLDESRLNIHGGAIALGHPVGASGTRITLHLAHALAQQQQRRGIAAICIGGGQGGAILMEAL